MIWLNKKMTVSKGLRPRHSQDIKDKILELKAQGIADKVIAETLNVKFSYIRKVLRKNPEVRVTKEQHDNNRAIARRKNMPTYPADITERILELYLKPTKREDIAKILNVDINKVISDIQLYSERNLTKEEWMKLRPYKYTKDQKRQIIDLRKSGKSLSEISSIVDIAEDACRAILYQNGIKLDESLLGIWNKTTTPDQDNQIIDLRKEGLSRGDISEKLDISKTKVKKLLEDNGVRVTKEVAAANATRNKQIKFLEKHGIESRKERYDAIAASNEGKYLGANDAKVSERATWECKGGHRWEALIYCVLAGTWCPNCKKGPSKPQLEIDAFIKSLGLETTVNAKDIIGKKELDIFVPSHKFAVEFNGLIYHSYYFGNKENREVEKFEACEKNGITLLMIYEDEWRDNPELIKSMIKFRLGKFDGIKLNARDLELRRIDKNADFKVFFNRNHLEGHVKAKFAYGLFDNNRLVMCASVRRNFNKEWELARLATDYDINVRGGASKLISAILNEINDNLVSYSNNRLSTGGVYKGLNAKEITVSKKPNYYYTDFKNRIDRFSCRRINDPEVLSRYPGIGHSEREQCESGMMSEVRFGGFAPLFKIEDCGHKKWLLQKPESATIIHTDEK